MVGVIQRGIDPVGARGSDVGALFCGGVCQRSFTGLPASPGSASLRGQHGSARTTGIALVGLVDAGRRRNFPFRKRSLPFGTVVVIFETVVAIHNSRCYFSPRDRASCDNFNDARVHENRSITYFRITFAYLISNDIRSIDSKNGGQTT